MADSGLIHYWGNSIFTLILTTKFWGMATTCRIDLSFWSVLEQNWNYKFIVLLVVSSSDWWDAPCTSLTVWKSFWESPGTPWNKLCCIYACCREEVCCAGKECHTFHMRRLCNKLWCVCVSPGGIYILCVSGDRQFRDALHIVPTCELLSMPCLSLSGNQHTEVSHLQTHPSSTPSWDNTEGSRSDSKCGGTD